MTVGWALEVSRYIHLNPVRVKGPGLGKAAAGENRVSPELTIKLAQASE